MAINSKKYFLNYTHTIFIGKIFDLSIKMLVNVADGIHI